MGYSIAEVAEKTHLSPHTLRYYEKKVYFHLWIAVSQATGILKKKI